MSEEVLIKVENVKKKFCRSLRRSLQYGMQDIAADLMGWNMNPKLRRGEFYAVDDISFELRRRECLGIIGKNGAGKTTLLKMLNGLIKPDAGKITVKGQVGALIALGAGFNPLLSGRENIYVNGAIPGECDAQKSMPNWKTSSTLPSSGNSSTLRCRVIAQVWWCALALPSRFIAFPTVCYSMKCWRLATPHFKQNASTL